jgi:hypothetical protein
VVFSWYNYVIPFSTAWSFQSQWRSFSGVQGVSSFLASHAQYWKIIYRFDEALFILALWLSGYSDRLEIYFLREQEFESLRRRSLFARFDLSRGVQHVSFGSEKMMIKIYITVVDFGIENLAWHWRCQRRLTLPRPRLVLSLLGEARVQILRSHLLLSYVEVVFPLTLL